MAGVGDKIDAHPLDAMRLGQIMQADQGGGFIAFDPQGRDMRFIAAFNGGFFRPDGFFSRRALQHARHHIEQIGGAQAA